MKILMALMGLDIGGAETHVTELARALHHMGHEVILASNGGAFVPALEAGGIRHAVVPMNRRTPRLMLRSLKLLRQLIQQEQPDIVHAHARIPAFLCGILQTKLRFPLITTAHGMFEITPLLRLITTWGDRTVAVSQDIKDYLRFNYQVPEDQIHITVNGIDTDRFCPLPPDPALRYELGLGDGPVVMMVSRMDTESVLHAPLVLIAALPELIKRFPDAELLIVGGGEREAAVRQQAERMNLRCGRRAVHLTGSRTDVQRLLPLATVFVGVSRAALEAMSEGKPVLLAGNPDYGQGYMGLLTPEKLEAAMDTNFTCRGYAPVSAEELARDLTRTLSLPDESRRKLGDYGRSVVLEHYSVHRMVQDYLQAYDRLLHGPSPLHAVISGYYGYENLGDDAILCAISRQLSRLERPVRLTVLSKKPGKTANQYGLPAIHRFSPFRVLSAIRKSDLLISGGGSLLQDRTSTRSLLYYLSVIHLAQLLHKPAFLYANGIGPINRAVNRKRVCRTVDACRYVTLRDEDSRRELAALGVSRQDMLVTADPAFTLHASTRGRRLLTALGVPEDMPLLGVSLRPVPGIEKNLHEFAALCDRLSAERHRRIVFLIMQQDVDAAVSRQVQKQMTAHSYLIETPGRPEDMLSVIREMDAVVSMRLHTIIFAAKMRVPVVGCVYDPKVTAFLHMLGMPSCGTPESLEAAKACRKIAEVLERRAEWQEILERRVAPLEQRAAETPLLVERLFQ